METNKPRKRKKARFRYGKYLFEAFTILFGVLLGFVVNQWRENLHQKRELSLSMELVQNEIYANATDIITILEKTDTSIQKLMELKNSVYLRKNRKKALTDMDMPSIHLTTLKCDSWEACKLKGLSSYIPVEELAELTNMYDMQAFILRINSQFVSQMGSVEYFKPQNKVEALGVTIGLSVYLKELQKNVLRLQTGYLLKFAPGKFIDLQEKVKVLID